MFTEYALNALLKQTYARAACRTPPFALLTARSRRKVYTYVYHTWNLSFFTPLLIVLLFIMSMHISSLATKSQVRIAEADNTAQYWPNIGSQESAIVIEPVSLSSAGPMTVAFVDCLNWPTFSRNLAQYRPYTNPIDTFTMASSSESRRARVRPMNSKSFWKKTRVGHSNYSF